MPVGDNSALQAAFGNVLMWRWESLIHASAASRTKTFLCMWKAGGLCLQKCCQAQGDAPGELLLSAAAIGQSCLHHHRHLQR